MRCRDRAALNLGPLLVRLPLAIIFLWAGLGKLVADVEIGPDHAVVLSAAGVRLPKAPAPVEGAPTLDQPLADPPPGDTPAGDAPAGDTDDSPSGAEPAGAADEPGDPPSSPQARHDTAAPARIVLARHQDAPPASPAAADDATLKVRRVNSLIILMHYAAEPEPSADGSTPPAIWPRALTAGSRPKILAWAACFTEIFAGFFLIIGLLTRFSALSLAGVMGVAIWLTTIGPAIQSGSAVLGFLPSHGAWSPEWQHPLFQLIILMAALSLVCTGPGPISLDRAIFAPGHDEDDDWDDDSLPQSLRERHAFDRSP